MGGAPAGGLAVVLAFLMGVAVVMTGGNPGRLAPVLLLVDLACIGALIWMAARVPRRARALATPSRDEMADPIAETAKG